MVNSINTGVNVWNKHKISHKTSIFKLVWCLVTFFLFFQLDFSSNGFYVHRSNPSHLGHKNYCNRLPNLKEIWRKFDKNHWISLINDNWRFKMSNYQNIDILSMITQRISSKSLKLINLDTNWSLNMSFSWNSGNICPKWLGLLRCKKCSK